MEARYDNDSQTVIITMTRDEAYDMTFEIAMSQSAWCASAYLRGKYGKPGRTPLTVMHAAVLKSGIRPTGE